MSKNRIFFVIPAYNEESQIETVLLNIADTIKHIQYGYHILLIDDGSTDKTREKALAMVENLNLNVISHVKNSGVAKAFRTGFDHALKIADSNDLILTMEANKNSDPAIIPDMTNEIQNGADLVLASCYAPGGRVINDPFFRLFLSKSINFILRVLFPLQVHTFTSFYRLWKVDLLRQLKESTNGRYFNQEGFVCMADILIKSARLDNAKIVEVPLTLISDVNESGSKMKIFQTIWGYVKLISNNIFFR